MNIPAVPGQAIPLRLIAYLQYLFCTTYTVLSSTPPSFQAPELAHAQTLVHCSLPVSFPLPVHERQSAYPVGRSVFPGSVNKPGSLHTPTPRPPQKAGCSTEPGISKAPAHFYRVRAVFHPILQLGQSDGGNAKSSVQLLPKPVQHLFRLFLHCIDADICVQHIGHRFSRSSWTP